MNTDLRYARVDYRGLQLIVERIQPRQSIAKLLLTHHIDQTITLPVILLKLVKLASLVVSALGISMLSLTILYWL